MLVILTYYNAPYIMLRDLKHSFDVSHFVTPCDALTVYRCVLSSSQRVRLLRQNLAKYRELNRLLNSS